MKKLVLKLSKRDSEIRFIVIRQALRLAREQGHWKFDDLQDLCSAACEGDMQNTMKVINAFFEVQIIDDSDIMKA